MTRSVILVAVGVALLVAGLTWWFGPPALVTAGVALVVTGLLVDEEVLTNGKPPQPPPR